MARAAAFRVVYRVDDTAGPEAQVATDVIQVAEPWNGLLEHRDGPPPGTTVLSSTVQNQRFTFNTAQSLERLRHPAHSGAADHGAVAGGIGGGGGRRPDRAVGRRQGGRRALHPLGIQSLQQVLAQGTPDANVESCVTADGVRSGRRSRSGGGWCGWRRRCRSTATRR